MRHRAPHHKPDSCFQGNQCLFPFYFPSSPLISIFAFFVLFVWCGFPYKLLHVSLSLNCLCFIVVVSLSVSLSLPLCPCPIWHSLIVFLILTITRAHCPSYVRKQAGVKAVQGLNGVGRERRSTHACSARKKYCAREGLTFKYIAQVKTLHISNACMSHYQSKLKHQTPIYPSSYHS